MFELNEEPRASRTGARPGVLENVRAAPNPPPRTEVSEALQQADLLGAQLDLALAGGLLEPQRPLLLGQQFVTRPHAADASGGDLHALERQLLGDPQGTVGGMIEGTGEDANSKKCAESDSSK